MTPHDLIAAFDAVAEAPDGVERLRELVLQLAVRGKLVPQDPADEPATVLLARAKSLKEQAVARGEVPTPQALRDRLAEVMPLFEVPSNWRWARLDDVGLYVQRGKSPAYDDASSARVVSQKCVQWSGFDLTRSRGVRESSLAEYGPERFLRFGDVLWNSTGTGTVGRVNSFPGVPAGTKIVADSHVTVIRVAAMNPAFVCAWLASPAVQDTIGELTTGTTKQQELNTSTVRLHCIPVPPLAEQHRIVARVDELMGLLDRLEAARTTRDAARAATRDSALDALWEADTLDGVEVAWNRFAGRLDDLLREPADIAPLRQAVLQLAVRGRLVPQDPTDEPASVLLERITADRAGAVAAKLTRMGDDPGGYDEEDSLPVGWEWAPLQDVVQFIDYRGKTPPKTADGVRLITAKNIRDGYVTEEPREFVSPKTYEGWMTRGFPRKGDVLFTTEAPMGKAALIAFSERFALAQRAINLHPYADLDSKYLMWMLLSPWFQERLRKRATGMTATGIKGAKLRLIRVPIPPVDEQRRIVARVDELMGLLDRLEERLAVTRNTHAAFAAAVHHLDA